MVQTGCISGAKWVFRWCKMGVSVVQTVFQTALIRGLKGTKILSTISTVSTAKAMPVCFWGKRACCYLKAFKGYPFSVLFLR